MVHELPEVREAGGHRGVVPVEAGGIGVLHRVRELLQRRIVHRERFEAGKHPSEHSRIALA